MSRRRSLAILSLVLVTAWLAISQAPFFAASTPVNAATTGTGVTRIVSQGLSIVEAGVYAYPYMTASVGTTRRR